MTKKFCDQNFGPTGLNKAQNKIFHHFLKFGSKVFLEIEYDHSLRQCKSSISGKTHEK